MKKITSVTLISIGVVLLLGTSQGHRRPKRRHSAPASAARTAQAQRDLSKLRAEIAKYEAELRDHEAREAQSKKHLKAFDATSRHLRQTIERLKAEADALTAEKSEVDTKLTNTAAKLDEMKSAYARGVVYLYESDALKSERQPLGDALLIGGADSAIRMQYYAQAIAHSHRANGEALDRTKSELGASSNELANSITSQQQAIGKQNEQAQQIEQKKAEEAKQLAQIQAKKAHLRTLLDERRASERKLEAMIAGLVTREEKAGKTRTKRHEAAEEPLPGPAHGPHSLVWPSASHHVVQDFGEHRNAELNTVTMNLGIDIAAAKGSAVTAAADGVISIVSTLPSYGTIVVVKHSSGLHTVYADLASSSVHNGERIRAGQTIGRSGTTEESGAVLHFEVWKGRAKQNPLAWLK